MRERIERQSGFYWIVRPSALRGIPRDPEVGFWNEIHQHWWAPGDFEPDTSDGIVILGDRLEPEVLRSSAAPSGVKVLLRNAPPGLERTLETKLESLETIRRLVREPGTDAVAVLELVRQLVGETTATELTPEGVRQRLEVMRQHVVDEDFETAHIVQVRLYEEVLEHFADKGQLMPRIALEARKIVTRWE